VIEETLSSYQPTLKVSSALLERFAHCASTGDFRRLSHDRLMEESQRRLRNAVLSDEPDEGRVATRILDSSRLYRDWENEHSMLMRRIAAERLPGVQRAQLLTIALALIHRKALFEYLRDERVHGRRRAQIMGHFFSRRDCASAIVAEHGRYLQSAASYFCSSYVGSNLMFDALFESPLAEYEGLYASYFRTYCDVALADDRNPVAASMEPVLFDLKAQIGEWRQALIALTHSQSGTWRRPAF
jgi:hypothetical protein